MSDTTTTPDQFRFRDLHPGLSLGTASDRYAGWLDQIYPRQHYADQITRRKKKVGRKTYTEEVLPVKSVAVYFKCFSILEIDFTFYTPLLNEAQKPASAYHVLKNYRQYLTPGDGLFLKVPQRVCARYLWQKGRMAENPDYLDPELFTQRFYLPATLLLGDLLLGFIFEQEYHVKKSRLAPEEHLAGLERFFTQIPDDTRYHLETRTEAYLTPDYFDLLGKYGVGQVLSHWTWLPPLSKQLQKAQTQFFNAGRNILIRLVTPLHMRYADTYAKAFPFDELVDGMMHPAMLDDTLRIVQRGLKQGLQSNVIINNRAGGNAPLIARELARGFLAGALGAPNRDE